MKPSQETYFVEPVVFVGPSTIQPVGLSLKKIVKKIKKAVKKIAKPLIGVVASVALPGVGGLLVNGAMTAVDIQKAKKEQKKVIAAAKKADAAAIKQVTDAYDKLKTESDAFRAQRGLPPMPRALPDLKSAKPEQVELAFSTLQDDAAAILARETAKPVTSLAGDTITPEGTKSNTHLYVAGAAVAGLAVLYFATRKRR